VPLRAAQGVAQPRCEGERDIGAEVLGLGYAATLHKSTFAYAFMLNVSVDVPPGMLWPTGNG
jgi:hypothetical protein